MERNLEQYKKIYDDLPFEKYQVLFRRKNILKQIKRADPQCVLEIGCGNQPLYREDLEKRKWVIVEPEKTFYKRAKKDATKNVVLYCKYFEECVQDICVKFPNIDYIVCSCLLHEVENPEKILAGINQICNKNTIVYINVPNANSLHRILAKEMNLISNVYEMSEQQKRLQQSGTVYDIQHLTDICEKNGLQIINQGSYFIKPFTHQQMQECLDYRIFDMKLLEGLNRMIEYLPEYGSEIFVECKKYMQEM